MKKKQNSVQPWAVLFWLLVWQGVSMALAAAYPHGDFCWPRLPPLSFGWRNSLPPAPSGGRWLVGPADSGGIFISCILAVLLAALSGGCRVVRELLYPLVAAVKAVPVASFIILALVWLDAENLSMFISVLMVFPTVYGNVLAGIEAADGRLLEMARVFRVPLRRQLPGDLPAAGAAILPLCCIAGPGTLLESGHCGGGHRPARRIHGRAAVHR